MGEKGDEPQLLGFLNAVLKRTGKQGLTSVEILENKDLPPALIGGKAGKLDVRSQLADGSKANIEVQLKNLFNMAKRSLYYWGWECVNSIKAGQDYRDIPIIIGINILNFEYLPLEEYHTSFHLREDREVEYVLTDTMELHFIEMPKFRRKAEKDVGDSLERWLIYLDEQSSEGLVGEVVKMDGAIALVAEGMERIRRDPALLHAYHLYEMGLMDEQCRLREAEEAGERRGRAEGERRGKAEGEQKGKVEAARNALVEGIPIELISRFTGLDVETIKRL
jgi:predicted transposase/invertase (TIGR01784 family)